MKSARNEKQLMLLPSCDVYEPQSRPDKISMMVEWGQLHLGVYHDLSS